MQLTNAISLEGYLEKESPTIIKIYQKRYFTFRTNGQYLVWFKKKPQSLKDPKGVFKTIEIESVEPDDIDERVFTIKFDARYFKLRAESKQGKQKWINSITTVIQHLKKALRNRKPQSGKNKAAQFSKQWKWDDIKNSQVSQLIRMQNQKYILNEKEDSMQQSSQKQLQQIIGASYFQLQKCLAYGYLNRKAFIGSDMKWYFLCSQFNLYDDHDDIINEQIKPYLEKLDKKEKVKNKQSTNSSEQDSDQQPNKAEQSKNIQINALYQYDMKTKSISQKIDLVDIIDWNQSISQEPYKLTITYVTVKENNLVIQEDENELVLQSNYMSEIKKWNMAIRIVFQRYCLINTRQKLLEQRFQKFQITMLKIDEETEWRILGTSQNPQYIHLNKDSLKISGFTYQLEDVIGSIKTAKLEIVIKQAGSEQDITKQASITTINFNQNRKLQIVFNNKEKQKQFKKKLKKYIKKLQENTEKNKEKQLTIKMKQSLSNENTYLIDKKIRQTSNSIKINFYQMQDRDVSTMKQQNQPKKESFLDRFLGIFCSPSNLQDNLY